MTVDFSTLLYHLCKVVLDPIDKALLKLSQSLCRNLQSETHTWSLDGIDIVQSDETNSFLYLPSDNTKYSHVLLKLSSISLCSQLITTSPLGRQVRNRERERLRERERERLRERGRESLRIFPSEANWRCASNWTCTSQW